MAGLLMWLKEGDCFWVGDAQVIIEEVQGGRVTYRVIAPREVKIVRQEPPPETIHLPTAPAVG